MFADDSADAIGGIVPRKRFQPPVLPMPAVDPNEQPGAQPDGPPNPFEKALAMGTALGNSSPSPAPTGLGAPPVSTEKPAPTLGAAPAASATVAEGTPRLGAASQNPQVIPAQAGITRKPFFSAAERGIKNPVLRTLAQIADVAGSVMMPGITDNIPGTRANENIAQNRELARNKEQAETAEKTAQAARQNAEAAAAGKPKIGATPEEVTLHDLMTGENGQPRVNPDTGKPYSYLEAYQATKQAAADTKVPPADKPSHITYDSGIPVSVVDPKGKVYDVNDPNLPPELKPLVAAATRAHSQHVTEDSDKAAKAADRAAHANDTKRSAAESIQVERESRAAVHKAEQDYNGARSTVAMQRELIKEAKGGNKEAVRMVPLEGALEITTSQGVHRINRTEVEQYGSAGSFFDKIKGAIGSGLSGKNIPDNVLADMDKMTQEMEKNAYGRYKREYDYNKSVVEGYGGKDFDKRVPPIKQEAEESAAKQWNAKSGRYE